MQKKKMSSATARTIITEFMVTDMDVSTIPTIDPQSPSKENSFSTENSLENGRAGTSRRHKERGSTSAPVCMGAEEEHLH
jgi:hypothetical protein